MTAATLSEVAAAIRAHRFVYSTEENLQAGISAALVSNGWPVEWEVILDSRSRIDLRVDRIGIEVKVAGRYNDVETQLRRYLESPDLDGVVLVTNRVRHLRIEDPRLVVVTLTGTSL